MNINIYVEDDVGKEITKSAASMGKTRNAVIREALKEWLLRHRVRKWPASVKKFTGLADFPAFELYRDELEQPDEDPFA